MVENMRATGPSDRSDGLVPGWRRSIVLLSSIIVVYAALLVLEGVAISWIDRWLPVSSFEAATRAALFVTAGLMWCRLCLIGVGVWLLLRAYGMRRPGGRRFAVRWATASMLVSAALLAVEFFQHMLQYGGANYSGEAVRSILLALVYAKIVLVYPGVQLLFGAMQPQPGAEAPRGRRAISFVDGIKLFVLLLVLKLIIENVLVTVISYLPFVAPFWFIPGELSELRYFVGQGTRIVAESSGAAIYAAFFVVVVRRRLRGVQDHIA